MIKVLFFARVKEELDCARLDIPWQRNVADLDSLQEHLCREGGPQWQAVLNRRNMIRAVNQAVVNDNAELTDGDEVAFFHRLPVVEVQAQPALAVSVQAVDFDVAVLQRQLLAGAQEEGAIATFTGYVRAANTGEVVQSLELEHYPGMTEGSIGGILEQACERWPLLAATVVHRIGLLLPGDQIVWVGVASSHRGAAFSACEFVMDYLKNEAPFWKKEVGPQGARWVDARDEDHARAARWDDSTGA